jgi:5-methylcytosine-specific restriction endonuclease McrA
MSNYNQKYPKELLEPIVRNSVSVAEILRKLGLQQSGGNHSHITRRIKLYELDTSHFISPKANLKSGLNKLSPEQILVNDRLQGRRDNVTKLRRALLESGVEHKCAVCGLLPFWNGKYLQLQIDHIDGEGTNNRIENLRFICGNCHMQTETFGIKNADIPRKVIVPPTTKIPKVSAPKPAEIDPNWRHKPRPNKRKAERPSKEELSQLLWEISTSEIARQFGVSDNAVAKWAKTYGLAKPPRGYWAQQKSLKAS